MHIFSHYSQIAFIGAAKVIMWCCTHMQIHTSRMTLSDDVNLEEFVMTKDEFSGADIKAICTEAGLLALRERRMKVSFLFSDDICLTTQVSSLDVIRIVENVLRSHLM
jgi:SpoVK/Ycf46/Vps4 family AAA+-type ATPase